jgi:DNA polymerase bacteriophage-type
MKAQVATIDFESRSACNIRKSGSWKYSTDPSTEPLCLAFRLPHWKKKRTALWAPAFPHLGMTECGVDELIELFNWIIEGELVEAHNAFFERGIWRNVMEPRFGWPAIAGNQWRCSAAKAAAHSLPRGLDDAASALGLSLRKDAAGSKVMMKMNKPRKPRKAERAAWEKEQGNTPMPLLWHESKELLDQLFAYCRQDVLVEEAVSMEVPDLSDDEVEMYCLDQIMNERGFLLDGEAVSAALDLIAIETAKLNAELTVITGGSPDKATQRQKMHDWFTDRWVVLEDTKAASIDEALKRDDLEPDVRRALELLQAGSRSSTAKYEAMRNWGCRDGRVRGGLLYHGAGTGRWAGAGVQPHNFPRGTVKDIDAAWRVLKTRDRAAIEAFDPKGKAA